MFGKKEARPGNPGAARVAASDKGLFTRVKNQRVIHAEVVNLLADE
jgi:hypothetical protein